MATGVLVWDFKRLHRPERWCQLLLADGIAIQLPFDFAHQGPAGLQSYEPLRPT